MISEFWTIDTQISNDLLDHVKGSTFYLKNPQICQCIDGRRTLNESNMGMSIPGWGIWQLAVMLAVLEETIISKQKDFREKALEILFDVLWGE